MYTVLAPARFGPLEIDSWLPYQLMAAYNGLVKANTPPDDGQQSGPPSLADWEAALAPGIN